MQYRNPFADAPEIAVELNMGLWAMAIGAIALEVGRQLQSGVFYYGIAPPLLIYGVSKLGMLFVAQEFDKWHSQTRYDRNGRQL